MGSMWAKIRQENTLGSAKTTCLADFDETDPYYFLIREDGKTIAEGELMMVKFKLDEAYLKKPIKKFTRTRENMMATVEY